MFLWSRTYSSSELSTCNQLSNTQNGYLWNGWDVLRKEGSCLQIFSTNHQILLTISTWTQCWLLWKSLFSSRLPVAMRRTAESVRNTNLPTFLTNSPNLQREFSYFVSCIHSDLLWTHPSNLIGFSLSNFSRLTFCHVALFPPVQVNTAVWKPSSICNVQWVTISCNRTCRLCWSLWFPGCRSGSMWKQFLLESH